MLASTLEEERESDSVLGLLNHVEGRVNFFPNNLYQGYPCQQYTDPILIYFDGSFNFFVCLCTNLPLFVVHPFYSLYLVLINSI